MAEVEVCPESVPVSEEKTKICESIATEQCGEKGDFVVTASEEPEVTKETEAAPTDATEKATEAETVCTTDVTADTTDGSQNSGVKRKTEEESGDDVKKVKTDAEGSSEAECCPTKDSEPAVVNGGEPEKNGCNHEENGKASDDIPPEIVTKTIEDALKPSEDVAAVSS